MFCFIFYVIAFWFLANFHFFSYLKQGISKAPIEVPPAPLSSRVRDETSKISVARITPAFDVSPLHATGTSKPSQPLGFVSHCPLAPLFAEGLPVLYVPKWKITSSTVMGTPETARDFLAYVMDELRRENEELKTELKTSQSVAAELRCRVTDAERKLLEDKERAWERERIVWAEEKEELVAELKHQKAVDSVPKET
ncbi:hypothetical protein Hdeb2414_s0018g00527231 [Helianthus debilis subsp. tardiflorus]